MANLSQIELDVNASCYTNQATWPHGHASAPLLYASCSRRGCLSSSSSSSNNNNNNNTSLASMFNPSRLDLSLCRQFCQRMPKTNKDFQTQDRPRHRSERAQGGPRSPREAGRLQALARYKSHDVQGCNKHELTWIVHVTTRTPRSPRACLILEGAQRGVRVAGPIAPGRAGETILIEHADDGHPEPFHGHALVLADPSHFEAHGQSAVGKLGVQLLLLHFRICGAPQVANGHL